jgi:phosphonate transport system ATP-binding protein
MLVIKNLSKQFPGVKAAAIEGINLTIEKGEWVAILGRSGSGKSTLIRCINRLVEPDSGDIRWDGMFVTGISNKELRRVRGHIGMVFQHFNLIPRLNVWTNVIMGQFAAIPVWQSIFMLFSKEYKQAALNALKRVDLEHLARRRVEKLSGGQRQRVAIARVLMQNPQLLLGDEPVSNLDPVTSQRVLQFISILHREHQMTVLLNLHDVTIAKQYATRIIGLSAGKVVFDGLPDQLGEAELRMIYPPDDEPYIDHERMSTNGINE